MHSSSNSTHQVCGNVGASALVLSLRWAVVIVFFSPSSHARGVRVSSAHWLRVDTRGQALRRTPTAAVGLRLNSATSVHPDIVVL